MKIILSVLVFVLLVTAGSFAQTSGRLRIILPSCDCIVILDNKPVNNIDKRVLKLRVETGNHKLVVIDENDKRLYDGMVNVGGNKATVLRVEKGSKK
jgi:hypothetical protein